MQFFVHKQFKYSKPKGAIRTNERFPWYIIRPKGYLKPMFPVFCPLFLHIHKHPLLAAPGLQAEEGHLHINLLECITKRG
jgi:hypothetical protein